MGETFIMEQSLHPPFGVQRPAQPALVHVVFTLLLIRVAAHADGRLQPSPQALRMLVRWRVLLHEPLVTRAVVGTVGVRSEKSGDCLELRREIEASAPKENMGSDDGVVVPVGKRGAVVSACMHVTPGGAGCGRSRTSLKRPRSGC